MYSAIDIANYFLKKSGEDQIPISNLKLQKMVYMANGFYLADTDGDPLLTDRIENWPYGPVISPLYHKFKIYGNGVIPPVPAGLNGVPEFSDRAKTILDLTWDTCKDLDAIKLSNWTHIEGSPWKTANEKGKSVLSDEDMAAYFKPFLIKSPS